ncbi:exonuclease domain-containing protein [Thalassobacillus hwangdonensis]|uniref:Exonuclease domain-containing protein n=1 Tax=Thalassobacillus hwangdonensis TaxID=546108 RepID=A0ABW3KZS6_9BACI
MNFLALDFETANSSRGSVCSIGIVEYENGQLKNEYYRLVKPKRNYFSSFNINVHGITPEDVADAPEFDELWESDIKKMLEGRLVVAHNAQFDMGVLRAVLDQYGMSYPMLAYNCTVNISKKTWHLPSYNLKTVANHIGFRFSHHHALEDAKASAEILMNAKHALAASDEKDLIEKTGTTNGMMFDSGYEPARLNKRKPARKPHASVYVAASKDFDRSHPFYGTSVVFSGKLEKMKREDAIQRVVDVGANWTPTIESTTNYVVVGTKAYEAYQKGEKSSKLERAEILMSQGYPIEIIDETAFWQKL